MTLAADLNRALKDPAAPRGDRRSAVSAVARVIAGYARSESWSHAVSRGFELHVLDAELGTSAVLDHASVHESYMDVRDDQALTELGEDLARMLERGKIFTCGRRVAPGAFLYLVDPLCLVRWTSCHPDCAPSMALGRLVAAVNRRFHRVPARTFSRKDTDINWYWFIVLTASRFCWTCHARSAPGARDPGFSKCGACGVPAYCSKACQRALWSQHKDCCGAAHIEVPITSLRSILLEAAEFALVCPRAMRVLRTLERLLTPRERPASSKDGSLFV